MNEIVREFLLETHENLAQLDLDLITLEKEPGEKETLARVFRTLHTVKGTAGFLGLPKLQSVAHAAENLLSRLRDGELAFNPTIASGLLATVDAIRQMLDALEKTETEGTDEYAPLVHVLEELAQGRMAAAPSSSTDFSVSMPSPPSVEAAPPRVETPPPILAATIAVEQLPPVEAPPKSPSTIVTSSPADAADARGPAVSDTAIRVDVGLLDKLMTLVGELVLARNQIVQFSSTLDDSAFLGTVQRLNLLTTELQASVMKTRMQPIGNVWSKFPRIVRDLAVACAKQVRIDMTGQETELDKTILEAIRDPLTHLVRNAVDHGIETPEERSAAGKPPEGRVRLHAFHEGGKVIIEMNDDGKGIDPRRVCDKALRNGLITADQAARLSEQQLLNLVFLPGFSTAERVTQFSGRGVGMDVVRTHVEKIGGMVEIDSRVGVGTTIIMKIPLTLAIIPALTITSGGDRYAIPQVSLLELVRLDADSNQRGIEFIHGCPVYRLRGNLLPIVYLNRVLQVDTDDQRQAGDANIVVLQAEDRQFGLVVDTIHDTEEIVVKPLQKQIKSTEVFAGATIMGDGRVALILDVPGLAQRAHVVTSGREREVVERATDEGETAKQRVPLLVFAAADGSRMAMPLEQVSRLEEFPRASLERVGGRFVVQYRNAILPLVDVSNLLGVSKRMHGDDSARDQTVQVVVHAADEVRVGLIVCRILDIVQETVRTRMPSGRPGVLYNAVVQERVTEVLDVAGIVRAAQRDLDRATTSGGER